MFPLRLGAFMAIANSSESTGNYGETIVSSLFQLKAFRKPNYYLVNNLYFDDGNNSHQLDHVVICHKGIFVIETKHIRGNIIGYDESDKWTINNKNRQYTFYNPLNKTKPIAVSYLSF